MQKRKGIKLLRDKSGNATHLVIDINKQYGIVENLIDVIESKSRLKEKGKPANEVFKEISARANKKKFKK